MNQNKLEITINDLGGDAIAKVKLNKDTTLKDVKSSIELNSSVSEATIQSLSTSSGFIISDEETWRAWRTNTLESGASSITLYLIQHLMTQRQNISLKILQYRKDLLNLSEQSQDDYILDLIKSGYDLYSESGEYLGNITDLKPYKSILNRAKSQLDRFIDIVQTGAKLTQDDLHHYMTAKGKEGRPAIYWACKNLQKDTIFELLDAGASLHIAKDCHALYNVLLNIDDIVDFDADPTQLAKKYAQLATRKEIILEIIKSHMENRDLCLKSRVDFSVINKVQWI